MPDIDIDVKNREDLLSKIKHTAASRITDDTIEKHNSGVYFQCIPTDPISSLSSIDYRKAEDRGYLKVDILNLNIYNDVRSEQHLNELLSREPLWEMLEDEDIVNKLIHVSNHYQDLQKIKPKSVEELAVFLAIIRPAKRHLLDSDWNDIEKEIWQEPKDGSFYFKRSHSMAYAHAIVMQMNLLVEEALGEKQ